MKKIKYLSIAVCSVILSVPAVAQNLGGVVIKASEFKPIDMLKLSQFNNSYTTARVSAMGGAFTALGGDIASMGINPAGLGMYRSSEFSFTPALQVSSSKSDFGDQNYSRFAMNNVGAVFNLYQGPGALVSFSLGFSYNKQADFNERGYMQLPSGSSSIADVLALQLNGLNPFIAGQGWLGLKKSAIGSKNNPFDNPNIAINEWGAVLGYQSALLEPVVNSDANSVYSVISVDQNAFVNPDLSYKTRGSIGEYAISGGFNIANVLYLGMTIGFQDIYMDQNLWYEEYYGNQPTGEQYLNHMSYYQGTRMGGSAVNFKFGAIVRPVSGLRIGLAVHTPSFVNLDRQYYGDMYTLFQDGFENNPQTIKNEYTYHFNTPARLLAGISYTFSDFAALSFDYERVWYNKMKLRDESYSVENLYAEMFGNDFRPSNNFRAGVEVKPMPFFALRAGYAHYSSPLRDDDAVFDGPVTTKMQNISAGVGFRFGNMSLDMTYVYSHSLLSEYDAFYYSGETCWAEFDTNGQPVLNPDGTVATVLGNTGDTPITTASPIKNAKLNRHIAMLTLGFRF